MKKTRKKSDTVALNSVLVRRPIQRCFPIFIFPTFIAFIIGFLYPFVKGIYLSFCTFTTPRDAKFAGLTNYIKAFQDPSFVHAFWFTALFTIVSILAINILAFTVAYVLTQNILGANVFRTVFFMPNLIGGIVLGYIWSMIFDGILRYYDTYLLAKTSYGFWGLLILMCWQQVGYMMIIYMCDTKSLNLTVWM